MTDRLCKFVEGTLHRLFEPVLTGAHEIGILGLDRVGTSIEHESNHFGRPGYGRRVVRIHCLFHGANSCWYGVPERELRLLDFGLTVFAGAVRHEAPRIWSEMYEDELQRRHLLAAWSELCEAELAPPQRRTRSIELLRRAFARRLTHVRRNHARVRVPPEIVEWDARFLMDARRQDIDDVTTFGRETATDVAMRERAARERIWSYARDGVSYDNELTEFLVEHRRLIGVDRGRGDRTGTWPIPQVGTKEAQERGIKLLKENLTQVQLAQFEQHNFFDVRGGSSGKTYRIKFGRQQNVYELDSAGEAVCGWCFLPRGNLVEGDCMLGQKNALELFEVEALKIANTFAVGWGRTSMMVRARTFDWRDARYIVDEADLWRS